MTLPKYLPFDENYAETIDTKNFLGWTISTYRLRSGDVYSSYDGKRLIYEVGCNSVIYLLINPKSPTNYHFFLQPTQAFMWDITGRNLGEKVHKVVSPMTTVVKYEMYILLGMFSTISIPMLIIVTGSDMTVNGVVAYSKIEAAKNLSKDISNDGNNLEKTAPTLHRIFKEFIYSEARIKWEKLGKQLPTTIVKDEKTQAQLAGVLLGKATLSPNAFTGWTALFVFLSTAAIKSVTKSPDAYAEVLNDRYGPILKDLLSTNWDDPSKMQQAALQVVQIVKESGVELTTEEAILIIKEVQANPDELRQSLINIDKSLKEFNRAIK